MSYGTPLTLMDYPLLLIGSSIYRRTESSPLCTLSTPELAADVCNRLNASLAPRQIPYDRDAYEWHMTP